MSNYRNDNNERFANVFKALSNPHRLSIFMRLASCAVQDTTGNSNDQICTCVGVIGKDLDIAPSTVSHHLKELHRVGLIKMKRRGQTVDCWVSPEIVDQITEFLKQAALV